MRSSWRLSFLLPSAPAMSDASAAEHQHSAGIAALQAGDMVMAVQCLRAATALAPSLPRNWSNLGEALRRSGALAEAVQAFDHRVKLELATAGTDAVRFALHLLDTCKIAFQSCLGSHDEPASGSGNRSTKCRLTLAAINFQRMSNRICLRKSN
jgi:tetratricopeptide (TPR) repeat protein